VSVTRTRAERMESINVRKIVSNLARITVVNSSLLNGDRTIVYIRAGERETFLEFRRELSRAQ